VNVTDATFQSLYDSPLHLRWTAGSGILDPARLDTIQLYSQASAAEVFAEADRQVRELGTHRRNPHCDVLDLGPVSASGAIDWVTRTLAKKLRPKASTPIVVSWNESLAVRTTWGTFAPHWPSFCHEGRDDVAIVPEDGGWILYHHHDGSFYLGVA